jgi:hypothetical protein
MPFDANPLMLAGKIAMSYGKKQDQDQGGSGGMPVEPPYWHGHSWQPTGVTWNEAENRFSDGSPPTGPGGGPWKGSVIGPPAAGSEQPPGYEQPGAEEPEGYEDPGESETDAQNRRLTARNMKKKPRGRTIWDLLRG